MDSRGAMQESVFVFLAFICLIQVGLAQKRANVRSYVTWEDLKIEDVVDGAELGWRDGGHNTSRVMVVDPSGRGDSVTVQGAVDMVPQHNTRRIKIYVLPGIYREKVTVPKTKPYVSIIGKENDAKQTVISWNNKASDRDSNGAQLGTYRTASVSIESDYFCATGITFENTVVAMPGRNGMQAVALRVAGNKAFFYKVRVVGTQDTLLDESGSHYFYKSLIKGSIDFIFGSARSIYQECVLHSTAQSSGAVAAHHRHSEDQDTGFSFVNCAINGTGKIYLGRAWGNYSRVIYSNCQIQDVINPVGWSDWNYPERQKTAFFGEYKCTGKGAERGSRVPWSKNLTSEEAKPFMDIKFIYGHQWLRL